MNKEKTKPLFMWAGGKNKMIKHYLPYMPNSVNEYSEPFFGAGAMYLYVQKTYKPKTCYINDINSGIMNIYTSIKSNSDQFCSYVDRLQDKYIPLSKEDRKIFYYDLRAEHAHDYQKWNTINEAAVLYFLMKTGFNGIFQINKNTNNRFGTPSGLLNQKSEVYSKQNIYAWRDLLQNTKIYNSDYSNTPHGDFIFLDPPYRDSFTAYGTTWNDNNLIELINNFNDSKSKVFICNRDDDSMFFEKHKLNFNMQKFNVTYTAGRRKKVDNNSFQAKKAVEVLLYN